MEFFRFKRDIPFMRHALVFNIISLLTFLAAVFFLVTRGLNFSIEFTGGTAVEATYAQTADLARLRGVVNALDYGDVQVQNYGTSRDVIIRVPAKTKDDQPALISLETLAVEMKMPPRDARMLLRLAAKQTKQYPNPTWDQPCQKKW